MQDRDDRDRFAALTEEDWLEVTTRAACRVACEYCPQDRFVSAFRSRSSETELSLATFSRCLQTVPRDVRIVFAGFTEPWLNPQCTDAALHAAERGHPICVYTTCAGMTLSDVERLRNVDVERMVVHLPTTSGVMRLRVDEDYLRVIDEVARWCGERASYIHHGHAATLHPEVVAVLSRHGLAAVEWALHSRAGHLERLPAPRERYGPVRCTQRRERKNVLLPDGSVALCCMDFGLQHVLGNLLQQDYADLFSGSAYRALVESPSGTLCHRCEWAEPGARGS